MRVARFFAQRAIFIAPQVLGVMIVTFVLIRLIPGDPAAALAGPFATPGTIRLIREQLGLTSSLPEQFWIYVTNIVHGDWGHAITTGRPVLQDIGSRLPATLELVTLALIIKTVLAVAIGAYVASRPKGIVDRLTFVYVMAAGAFPDFWLGLVLSYLLFFKLGWFPAPTGRLDISRLPPPHVTGFYTVDSLIAGQWSTFADAVKHLVLPVMTLVLVYGGATMKMTRVVTREMLASDFVRFAEASGLSPRVRMRYALRNALPPIVTMVGIAYSFLLGGAVLVESVFAWGGLGQYAAKAVEEADYAAVQGFVLVAALFNLVVYLVVDFVYTIVDPRIEV